MFLAMLPLTFVATPAVGQDVQGWEQLNVIVPLAPSVRVTLEQIARVSDRQGGPYTTKLGALLGLQVAPGVELGFGYRHVGFHSENLAANENRFRQQVVIARGRFAGRLRLDERFNPLGSEIGFRVRPLLRYNLPTRRERVVLFVSHESFILPNSTAWGQRAGYERMRNIVGVTFPIGPLVMADLGYLNQYRIARGGARGQMDNAVTIQLTINLGALSVAALND
ncbi:DUF2490 domain-containing protein [Sphingomonas montana]|uniref:DUF2490 domain-containing protein n=1 Tax=Sphingomonas montana TaxID=1843236 RepID=UPI001F0A78B8|nr:DUF2490 domain-containing protein [Sphingomonas montana]